MTKTMTAAAALLLGVALAATAQAANTTRQSAAPATDTQQTAQTGTTAAPQVTKKRTTHKLSKRMVTHRQVAAKRTGKKLTTMAKLTRHSKLQQTARLHRRSLRGQEQSTAIGSSTMPSTSAPALNTLPPATNAPMAGSGSSMMPQGQPNTLQTQPLNQSPTTTPPIR